MSVKGWCFAGMLLLVTGSVRCQELHRDSTRRTQGTTEVIVFSKEGGSNNTSKTEAGPNVVKAGVTDWPAGYIPFYYERRILPWLSIQAGVGITTRDFIADEVNTIILHNEYATYRGTATARRKSSVGPFASIQPKFYVRSDAPGGFFVSPMLAFKQWNYRAFLVDNTTPSPEPIYSLTSYKREYRNAIDFTVNVGWQWEYDPLTLELMLGAGFRKFWESRQSDPTPYYSGGGTYYTDGSTVNYSGFRPDFNVSLNFGGFF